MEISSLLSQEDTLWCFNPSHIHGIVFFATKYILQYFIIMCNRDIVKYYLNAFLLICNNAFKLKICDISGDLFCSKTYIFIYMLWLNKIKLEIAWYISAMYKPVFVPLHKNYAFLK